MSKSATRNASPRKPGGGRSQNTSNRKTKTGGTSETTRQRSAAKARNNIAAETVRGTRKVLDAPAVSDTFRVVAEQNVVNARELFEGSRKTLQAVLESWQKTFGAAGQSAVALNRRIIDTAERNMETSFDLAVQLAGARNVGDVAELQAIYWRRVLGEQDTPKRGRSVSKRRVGSRNH